MAGSIIVKSPDSAAGISIIAGNDKLTARDDMLTRTSRPKLAPKVKLNFDRYRKQHTLSDGKAVLEVDAIAASIIELCDGRHTIAELSAELAKRYSHDASAIEEDVLKFLIPLSERCFIDEYIPRKG